MNILVQDQNFVPIKLIDTYKSAIWTERFREAGDFEIVTSVDALDYIQKGYYLTRPDSDRVMIVEGFQIETDSETGNWLIVNGRSIESILDRRIIWNTTNLESKLDYAIKRLITENVISPAISDRAIPNIIYADSSDPYIDSLTITAQFTGDNLYDTICSLCETYDIGWKITLKDIDVLEDLEYIEYIDVLEDFEDQSGNKIIDASGNVIQAKTGTIQRLAVELYPGSDRSYEQTENPYVVFSPSFDNIINSQYVESDKELKDVALVAGEEEGDNRRKQIVGSNSGIERRELYVDARDLQSDSQQLYDSGNPNIASRLYCNPSTMKYGSLGTNEKDRVVYIAVNPNTEYSVRRTEEHDWIMRLASSPALPALNGTISVMVTTDDRGDPITDNGTIVTGPNDHYLAVHLFDDVGEGEGATIQNATIDFTISGKILDSEYMDMLTQRGQEKLAECKAILSFDGEVDYKQMYKYGEDFFMGDICELENEYRISCKVRVMELVASDDENGYSIYPTFTSYGGSNS